jgi:hypothetical protein
VDEHDRVDEVGQGVPHRRTVVSPAKATGLLDRSSAWLERRNRVIMIVLGLVFGTWFLIKALNGLDVI